MRILRLVGYYSAAGRDFHITIMRAPTVPRWSTAILRRERSSAVAFENRRRCPELEIGSSSVTPWIVPAATAVIKEEKSIFMDYIMMLVIQ